MDNILDLRNPLEFREWLENNSLIEKECFILLKRGKPKDDNNFYYIDAVYEALCFGWIDSTLVRINNKLYQRFSPRSKNSYFSELNKERARYLIYNNKMTDKGLEVCPNLDEEYIIDNKIIDALSKNNCLDNFNNFPKLYQKVRSYNVIFYYNKDIKLYKTALNNLIKNTKQNKMYGSYDDYGRLSNYK